jgi:hypothetical protein
MFAQGSFINAADATPESIALKRAQIAALMPRFGQAKYVGEGLGQLATGIGMGIAARKLDKTEGAARKSAQERFNAILGGGMQGTAQPGGFSVLGSMPVEPMAPPDPNSPHALGNDAMAALGKAPMQTAADPASIRQGLIDRGLPEHIADGFVMNFQDESGLNPGINEIAPLVPGSRGGFGLYQLTGPRRRAYEEWATSQGIPLDSVDGQLDFLMMELQGPEAAAASRIMAAPDAGSAAASIVTDFLRPSPEHRDRRVAEYTGGGRVVSDAMNSPQMAAATVPPEQLMEIITGDFYTPAMKAQAQAMLDQQTQMNDPAYRMGLRADELAIQKAERELAQMDQPGERSRIVTGAEAAALGLNPENSYNITEGPNGLEASAIGGGGTTINNNMPGAGGVPELGKLSTDYTYETNPDGTLKRDEQGRPIAVAVPGSPAAIEAAKVASAGDNAAGADMVATETITTAASRAREAAQNREAGGFGAGMIASINPYSDSAEVERQIDVMRANAATTTLQAMRDASPTGSTGLGALTAPEMKVIQDKAGALNQNSPNFLRDLEDYERTLLRVIHGPEAGDRIFEQTREGAPTAAPEQSAVIDSEGFKAFAADPSAIAAAQKYGVTLEEMWAIKQGQQ